MRSVPPGCVLFVGAFPRPASLHRYVSGDLACRLQERGWKTLVTSRQRGRLLRTASIILETWRNRSGCGVACVDVFSGPAFVWAEAACAILRRAQRPHVLTLHGGNLPEFSKRHAKRFRRVIQSASAVTCPSPYLAAELKHLTTDLLLIPNGVDLSNYAFRERQPPIQRLIWLRAFHAIYNPTMAVKVLAMLRQHASITLTMVGPDKRDGSLQQVQAVAHQLGVQGAVAFPGAIPKKDVAAVLAQADAFINTTNFDNTPVSVIEAMASGLPIVTTNAGGIPYLLEHGKTALLVPKDDADAMCRALRSLSAESNLARDLGHAALKKAREFDWTTVLPVWENLLSRLSSSGTNNFPELRHSVTKPLPLSI